MIFRLIAIICSLLGLLSCAKQYNTTTQEVSIAYLKSLCRGDHYRIVDDYTIRGVVVANDWLGELHKSVVVVDSTGGLEIAIDSQSISNHLPIYSEVTILCNGLILARIGGKIELGTTPTDDFPLGNIDDTMLGRYIRVVGVCHDFAPAVKRFSEIGASDISNIVRFEDIRLSDKEHGMAWCDTDENGESITTYRTFVDNEGCTFAIRTLSTCCYGKELIPTDEIAVVGVIDYSDDRYYLRIVNKSVIR